MFSLNFFTFTGASHMGLLVVQAGHSNAQELQPTAEAFRFKSPHFGRWGRKNGCSLRFKPPPPPPLPQFGKLRTFWCSTIQTCCSHSSSFTKALRLKRKLLQKFRWFLVVVIFHIIYFIDNLTMILDYDTDSRIWSIFFVFFVTIQ